MDTNLYEQRTRVQNQQTNTFLKGMDTDTSDMLLGSDQYRYAENIRIITNEDNNSGEVRLIEGNVNIPIYIGNEPIKDIGRIMAFDAIRDIVILITEKDDAWSVYRVNIKDLRKYLTERSVYANPATKFLRLDLDKYVDGDSLYYDGHTITEPSMNNYISRKTGVFYEDSYDIEDDIKGEAELIFGPCTEPIWPNDWDGADKVITTVLRWEADKNIKLYIADATGKHSIMVLNVANKYNTGSFDDVFAYQRTLLPPADIEIGVGSGSIMSGKVQYVYRLYSKTGAATPLSVLSKTLSLYKNSNSGYEAEKKSGRSVDISINIENKGNLDYIQIYRISYQISGQLPKISLVKDEKITSSFVDIGIDVVENVAMSELLSMFTPFIYPKQIESKGDYLFAANMKYSQDDVDAQFNYFDSRSYSAGNKYLHTTEQLTVETNKVLNINGDGRVTSIQNILNNDILIHDAFTGENAYSYNSSHWKNIQYKDGNDYKTCNGYGKYICWKYDYDEVELNPQNQGSISYQKSTFRSGETYRFGVRLYDKYGRASSVKWIADIIIPDRANMSTINGTTKFRNVGIKFFKTPNSNWEGISGWEIVRCERTLKDRKAITQGIIGFPVKGYVEQDGNTKDTKMLCPPGVFSTDGFLIYGNRFSSIMDPDTPTKVRSAETTTDVIMFSSPEYCYQQDDIESILKSSSADVYLKQVYKCNPMSTSENIQVPNEIFQNGVETLPANGGEYVYTDLEYDTNHSFAFLYQPNDNTYSYKEMYWQERVDMPRSSDINPYQINSNRGIETTDSTYTHTYNFINYFKPDYHTFNTLVDTSLHKIEDFYFVDSPKSSDFAELELLLFKNNVTSIRNYLFINWVVPMFLDISGQDETDIKYWMDNINDVNDKNKSRLVDRGLLQGFIYPISSGGKTILLYQSDNNKINITKSDKYAPSITVYNLSKYCVPYEGYNKTAISNSSYISFGDYSSGNDICVFTGDTKNRIFTYNAAHIWYDTTYKNVRKMSTIYAIPVETDIDIQALYGTIYGVDGFTDYRIQDTSDAFDTYTQAKSAYMYNTAYNTTPDIVGWTSNELQSNKIDQFDTRIHYSNVKINNEDIDNWTLFLSANYIDVDTRYGEITDLKLFKDKLIFWQENATGILAVNERIVLNDLNDTQVVLGTGGVLERFDYFSTVYGQKKNQHVVATSNNSLYWWDSNNKEILLYQQKYDITPLSTVKSVKNYINKGEESDVPFMAYDNKYKELIANVVNNEALVYNEQVQTFTSIYKFAPMFGGTVNGCTVLTSMNKLYAHNIQYNNEAKLFGKDIHPIVSYVVNALPSYNKTYDIQTIGGRFYGGGYDDELHERNKKDLIPLEFTYNTPLKQKAQVGGDRLENVEYDYRLTIPRNGETLTFDPSKQYGNRLRGKFMKCEIKSNSNNLDFALQYITTKFRMSWT